MFSPDKSKLDQSALERYKQAQVVKKVIKRLEGCEHQTEYPPYTGTTSQEYVDWLTGEAMIGYEYGQLDSNIPSRIKQHAKNGIRYLNGLTNDWTLGNDKLMTIRQLINKARGFTKIARERLDPCFNISHLEADPYGEYETTYAKYEYVYLGLIDAAEECIRNLIAANNSPNYRCELKAALESVICTEIIPVLQSSIPCLEELCGIITPIEDIAH